MRNRFRGVRWIALIALVAGVVAVPSALADDPQGQAESLGTGLWFVELNGAPAAAGGNAATNKAQKAEFRAEAKQAKVSFTERFAFDTLWNGLSIKTSASADTLSSISGVKAVYPVLTASIPPTDNVSPDLVTALAMTGADVAQSELGYDGTGVKVAVMDTGIDLDHPDLGGDGVAGAPHPNTRVVAQHDFVGDAFNANPADPGYNPTPVPDPVADDCNSHGTHVSGIVGANGAVTGVAPGVTFGAYRVFGCGGSTTTDIMIAAMERALADDMDILNMSIGSAFNTWPQYPTAAASDTLVNAGVSVVASIGNSGANGLYSAGAPGVGNKVIGVASFDNTHTNVNAATVTPAGLTVGYINMTGTPPPPPAPFSGSLPLARPSGDIRGCTAADWAGFPAGSAALVQRGSTLPPPAVCGFALKAQLAQAAGAAAVIIFNNIAGSLSGTLGANSGVTIPTVGITQADGNAIVAAMAGGPQTWNWTSGTVSIPNPTGGLISSFSSYGLGAELALKPDIGAPGGFIRSTFPIELGSYSTISGTSMASPHVAGAVALLLEAHPNTSQQNIRSILQNSADPKPWWGNPGLGLLDNVHRQGAGMLDVDDAILATTSVEPGKLSLGEVEAGSVTATLTIKNNAGSPVTYDLSHSAALATGPNTFTPAFFNAPSAVAFSQAGVPVTSVALPAGGTASFDVTITPNAGLANRSLFGGYVVLTPQGGGQVYRVPFAGFKGDYQSIPVMTGGFPFLGKLTACNAPGILRGSECFGGGTYNVPGGVEEYTLVTGLNETPFILAHFDHQARRMRVDVFRVSDGTNMGRAFNEEYLARNSTATSFTPFAWDGMVTKGKSTSAAPDDVYYFKLTLTKALGDSSTEETWTSPNFELDRP
jgi:minor extracellular serine protease Vpr